MRRTDVRSPPRRCCSAARLAPAAVTRIGRAAPRTDRPRCCATPSSSPRPTFDPAKIDDLYSRYVTAHIFEAPAIGSTTSRARRRSCTHTAAAMPETADDFRTWTIRIQPGIYFADDPAFKGKPRELVAADYVYALEALLRSGQPRARPTPASTKKASSASTSCAQEAIRDKKPFDYDREIEGVRALDRYTLQFRLAEAATALSLHDRRQQSLASMRARGRRVLWRCHRRASGGHGPVQAGRVATAARASSSTATPSYREVRYDGEPAADDAEGQAMLRQVQGPASADDRPGRDLDHRGEPAALAALSQRRVRLSCRVPLELRQPSRRRAASLAPYLARRGVHMDRFANADRVLFYFNMEDPVVGGMTVPTRSPCAAPSAWRSTSRRRSRGVRRGQAIAAQSTVAPGGYGYDPTLPKRASADYDVARAKALLDMYGYVDRDGDGWRDLPDGQAAGDRIREHAGCSVAPVRRALEEESRRHRRAPAHQDGAVAGSS